MVLATYTGLSRSWAAACVWWWSYCPPYCTHSPSHGDHTRVLPVPRASTWRLGHDLEHWRPPHGGHPTAAIGVLNNVLHRNHIFLLRWAFKPPISAKLAWYSFLNISTWAACHQSDDVMVNKSRLKEPHPPGSSLWNHVICFYSHI